MDDFRVTYTRSTETIKTVCPNPLLQRALGFATESIIRSFPCLDDDLTITIFNSNDVTCSITRVDGNESVEITLPPEFLGELGRLLESCNIHGKDFNYLKKIIGNFIKLCRLRSNQNIDCVDLRSTQNTDYKRLVFDPLYAILLENKFPGENCWEMAQLMCNVGSAQFLKECLYENGNNCNVDNLLERYFHKIDVANFLAALSRILESIKKFFHFQPTAPEVQKENVSHNLSVTSALKTSRDVLPEDVSSEMSCNDLSEVCDDI
jgi:hypothetical protein